MHFGLDMDQLMAVCRFNGFRVLFLLVVFLGWDFD